MININELDAINKSNINQIGNKRIVIRTPEKTDFFNSPILDNGVINKTNSSPFYYKNVDGDFTIIVRVKDNFTHDYDAGAIFIYESDLKWIKLAFEKTDFGTTSIVSVVTDNTSDDANGANLTNEWVWLMASRRDDTFALHYSIDGQLYNLVRIFNLKVNEILKVGITAQSPIGGDSIRIFESLDISDYKLIDLRKGDIDE